MPDYLVVDEVITDPDAFVDYKRAVLPTIVSHGGRFLARGGAMEIVEAGGRWNPDRLVIVEFPSMEALKAWYDSADYAPARDIRLRAAKSTVVALEGIAAAPEA